MVGLNRTAQFGYKEAREMNFPFGTEFKRLPIGFVRFTCYPPILSTTRFSSSVTSVLFKKVQTRCRPCIEGQAVSRLLRVRLSSRSFFFSLIPPCSYFTYFTSVLFTKVQTRCRPCIEGQAVSRLLRVRLSSRSFFCSLIPPCSYFTYFTPTRQSSVTHSKNTSSNKYTIGMTQQPEPGPSTNTSPSDIRRSILEWTNKTAPQHIYTSIKGDARKNERGYVWKCTVFSGAIPPTPELGDRSDIYLDTSSRTIHVKEKPAEWTSWVPSSSINHPLGGKSRLRPHFNHGIRWQTNVAFTSHRAKFRSVSDMTVEDLFAKTFTHHSYLDPENLEGVGQVGIGKEVRSRKVKKESSVPSNHPTPAPQRIDNSTSPQRPPSPPRVPTPPLEDHHPDVDVDGEVDMDVEVPSEDEGVGMGMNWEAAGNDNSRRPLNNKRRRLDSRSSSREPSSPQPSPKPTFLSKLAAAPLPLFKRLLAKAKIWLNLQGIQFPKDAQIIQWVNGVWTVLPWHKCDESMEENPVCPIY
jgi:hypothetical protein